MRVSVAVFLAWASRVAGDESTLTVIYEDNASLELSKKIVAVRI